MASQIEQLQKLCDGINNKFGPNTIGLGNYAPVTRVPTGFLSLDVETGGGNPRSRVVQIYGPESSGKSFSAKIAAKEYQKRCICGELIHYRKAKWECSQSCGIDTPMDVAMIDLEGTDDRKWDERIGLDPDRLLRSTPASAEDAIDIVQTLLRAHEYKVNPPGLIIIDSVAAMIPLYLIEHEAEKQTMGLHARLVSKLMAKIVSALQTKPFGSWHYTTVLLINQTRTKISAHPNVPPSQDPTGGNALKFYNSITVRLKRGEYSDQEGKSKGDVARHRAEFSIPKNKTAPPRRAGFFEFWIDGDNAGKPIEDHSVIEYGTRYGVIDQSGSWFSYGSVREQGREKFLEALTGRGLLPEVHESVVKEATRRIRDYRAEEIVPFSEDDSSPDLADGEEFLDQ